MSEPWENYREAVEAITRRRHVKKKFLSQFWIWRPYSKYNLSEQELYEQGYENLGHIYKQKEGKQDEC